MSKRDMTLYIVDIFIASNKISRYIINFNNADSFLWSELEWDARLRELQIIGEATNKLLIAGIIEDKSFRRIVDFRNLIIHGYFGIDEEEVWGVATDKLPLFIDELREIVKEKNICLDEAIKYAKEENYKNNNIIAYLDQIEKL
jgi:uncharacterized protein with HEPN domain